ncbi:EcoKI restriction-modification system protein HsdS [compost metagenome]
MNSNTIEIPQTTQVSNGYKKTPIGLIPSDWEVKKLGEIAVIKGGKRIPKGANLVEENTGFPYIRVTDMYMGGVDSSKILFIPKHIEPQIKNYKISKNDLFITVAGTIGLIGEITEELDNANLTENANKITVKLSNKKYVYYTLTSELIQKIIIGTTTNNAQPKLALERIRDLFIPLPPLPEQQKIASILSTWDEAIDNCKGIIEELKVRNKGLAQQLLTGKMRVKGFEGSKWLLVAIKKIAKNSSKKNPSDKELIVLSCTKHNGLVPSLEYFGRKIYSDDLTTYKIVSKGQFAYATNHIEEGSIGYQSNYEEALISPMYTVFQTDETVNDNFLFRILKSNNYIHEYQKRMEGSIDRRGGLRWDEFSKIKVPVPELKEQNAIVEILDKATEELNQCQQKLKTLQLQKKGLMQQLLTGKVRVKI